MVSSGKSLFFARWPLPNTPLDGTHRPSPLPYTPAKSLIELFDIPMGTRKALEVN